MKCKICNNELTANHLRIHKISVRKYYDQYVAPPGAGTCGCGKKTHFRSFRLGYNRRCSTCANRIIGNNKREKYKKYKSVCICKICKKEFAIDLRYPRDICGSQKCRRYNPTDRRGLFDIKFVNRNLCSYCGSSIRIDNDAAFIAHLSKHFTPPEVMPVYEYVWRNVWKLPIPKCKNCKKECVRLNGKTFANFCRTCLTTLNLNGGASRKYFYNKRELKQLYIKLGKTISKTYQKKLANATELKKLRKLWKSNGKKISRKLKLYFASEKGKNQIRQTAAKQSVWMKKQIAEGKFIPNITNSWTHWESEVSIGGKIKRFRSSWEACFYLSNPHLEYETIRVPYIDKTRKERITIVDFYDRPKKILYEIKPRSIFVKQREKMNAVINYCLNNHIRFKWINEKNILKYVDRKLFSGKNLLQYNKMCKGINNEKYNYN